MRSFLYAMVAVTLLVLPMLWGCSGDAPIMSQPAPVGRAAVTIQWPATAASSRLIPVAAQSIKLTISDTTGFSATQTVARPASGNTSTVNFTNLPVGLLSVSATAYPQAGATGTPQATGTAPVTTLANQQVGLNLTMASTINSLAITSNGLSVSLNGSLQLTATAKDAANSTVLVASGNITWSSAAPGVASVNAATGLVTGVSVGTAVISARESDSQKSQTATVTVTGGPAGFTLTAGLDATLNRAGASKATAITTAELLNGSGAVVKTATITAGSAVIDMTGLATGDYFIRINNLNDDLVPTRLDSVSANQTQFIGQQLNQTVVGTLASPTYRMLTYSKGQGKHAVVNYTNGATSTPERYVYVLFALKASPRRTDIRVLGTGALLSSLNHANHSFPAWIMTSHVSGADDNNCDCHSPISSKPGSYNSIGESNGFCYQCHYGPVGSSAGMVDPTK